MIIESPGRRARLWPGFVVGLMPSVVAVAFSVISIPPRVLDVYDASGRRTDTGSREYWEQRPIEMLFPALLGYGVLMTAALVMIDLNVKPQLAQRILIGLAAGTGVMLIACVGQAFLDTYV